MNENDEVIPFDINLVHFDHPEVVIHKPVQVQIKQSKSGEKSFDSLVSSGDGLIITEGLECSDVLNRIMPPREWSHDGQFFRQRISNQPATQLEVRSLSQKLDRYLEQFKARDVGICPIKRQLYCQCFNEIIRQVTINCAERGYMLLRIREEIKMTINAYQELYESIVANGIRKALMAEKKKFDLEKKMAQLKSENENLEIELAEMIKKTEISKREIIKAHEAEVNSHALKLRNLKKANQVIKDQIEALIAPKK